MDTTLSSFGTPLQRVENALASLKNKRGILLVDDEDRENEGDLIFAAEAIDTPQMAQLIRYCSGIVCLCLTEEKADALGLPPMVEKNTSQYGTAFTVTIEAATGVTTGVSAADRVKTIQTAISPNSSPNDLSRPGHVFPLRARNGGVFERPGHTEGAVDLARLSGYSPAGILCELTNEDGSMARLPEVIEFARLFDYPVLTIQDLIAYRKEKGV